MVRIWFSPFGGCRCRAPVDMDSTSRRLRQHLSRIYEFLSNRSIYNCAATKSVKVRRLWQPLLPASSNVFSRLGATHVGCRRRSVPSPLHWMQPCGMFMSSAGTSMCSCSQRRQRLSKKNTIRFPTRSLRCHTAVFGYRSGLRQDQRNSVWAAQKRNVQFQRYHPPNIRNHFTVHIRGPQATKNYFLCRSPKTNAYYPVFLSSLHVRSFSLGHHRGIEYHMDSRTFLAHRIFSTDGDDFWQGFRPPF